MNKKLIYTAISIACFTLAFIGALHVKTIPLPVAPSKQAPVVAPATKKAPVPKAPVPKPSTPKVSAPKAAVSKELLKKVVVNNSSANKLALTQVAFEELPGWDKANVKKSLSAFQTSCNLFLKQNPAHPVGSQHIALKAGDWHPACKAALSLATDTSEEDARIFFERWFHAVELEQKKTAPGLFTGYYMPQLKGSLKQTAEYNTPIYGLPSSSKNYTRAEIDKGVLKQKAPVIAWINSPIERLFLEIEGSGVIKLPSGKKMYINYAGENGAPYTSIGKIMIDKGIMTRDTASKPAIKRYLENHPGQMNAILHQNKSFVYFQDLKKPFALGAKNTALTPGYSLAVDRKWIPLGAPLWLDTTRPNIEKKDEKQLQRLMIAQDTGGAIRGLIRGDVYWGSGKIAAFLGKNMKNRGRYWLLLPKQIFNRLSL